MFRRICGPRSFPKSAIALSVVLALGACSSSDDDGDVDTGSESGEMVDSSDADDGAGESIMVQLDASQEIPAPTGVPAEAMGTAEVSVDADGVVTATLTVSGLSGPAQMAHIHEGAAGETGGVLIGLESADGGTTWTVATDAPALTEEQITAFNNGGLYFNVHTEANMAGEIRGQINAENTADQAAPAAVMVQLDAGQEIPTPTGVPAEAAGTAEVSVDADGVVTATLTVSGLSGPAQMAHIHEGAAGETGGVLIGLESADGGTTWTVAADAPALTTEQVEAFNNGGLYFNVHTEANAPGEIRGQIEPNTIAASSTSQRLLSSVARSDGAETLLDTRTGLVWVNDIQFCMEGITRAVDAQCGALSDMAVSGITDWRLPTSDEMAEITRAVDADESVTLKYISSNCSVMTTSDGWVLNENSVAPGARSRIEPSDAGVRCVSGEIQ